MRTVGDGLPEGWWIDEGRKNSGTTIFSPLWPHGGEDGDLVYADASPTYGWRFLIRDAGASQLRGGTLAEALRVLPDELRDEVLTAHRRIEEQAKEQVTRWISRRRRFLRERSEVSKWTVDV